MMARLWASPIVDTWLFTRLMARAGRALITFGITRSGFSPACSAACAPISTIRVPLRRLFFEAGSLLTPLAPNMGARLAPWYIALRYLHWIAPGSSELRIRQDFRDERVDARYKGLLGEEMAIGMMAVILQDAFAAIRINNTVDIPDLITRKGKIADFVAVAPDYTSKRGGLGGATPLIAIIVESKGSVERDIAPDRKARALQQVSNTNIRVPRATQYLRTTFCSSIRYERQRKPTICEIADPEAEDQSRFASAEPIQMWRLAYARVFMFIGLYEAALAIARGAPTGLGFFAEQTGLLGEIPDGARIQPERNSLLRQRAGAQYILDLGDSGVAIDLVVLRTLERGISSESLTELEAYLVSRADRGSVRTFGEDASSFINGLGIGIVSYQDV